MCEISQCSFLILAGGKSSRMGTPKAQLPIEGKTFLEHMIEKGKAAGFPEILISGSPETAGYTETEKSVRIIPDILKDRGPLGGLYSCFLEASYPACFVISVDVPLFSGETIKNLIKAHEISGSQATLLVHQDKTEPLIGVYNTNNRECLYEIIKEHSASVFTYLRKTGYRTVELLKPLETISNINTPEEYKILKETFFSDISRGFVEKV